MSTPKTMGAERVKRIAFSAARLAPRLRAAHGLTDALVALYQPQLDTAQPAQHRRHVELLSQMRRAARRVAGDSSIRTLRRGYDPQALSWLLR
jgi:hypothetical protein